LLTVRVVDTAAEEAGEQFRFLLFARTVPARATQLLRALLVLTNLEVNR
jgi:hypothetical protein